MAQHPGKDILLKLGNGASPTEVFTTVAGLRSPTITIGEEGIDITSADSADCWREMLATGGTVSMSVSGNGVLAATQVEKDLRALIASGANNRNWEVIIPEVGTYTGAFMLSSLEYGGEYNQEASYTFSLESAGQIEFTAA